MDKEELARTFGMSELGNFRAVDTVGVPHPYCITPRHIKVASDRHFGALGREAILDAEKSGVHCGIRNCRLPYAEHKQALLVECKLDLYDPSDPDKKKMHPELHKYLLSIKELTTKNGFEGFAFLDERKKPENTKGTREKNRQIVKE